jgi:hypothetical protein
MNNKNTVTPPARVFTPRVAKIFNRNRMEKMISKFLKVAALIVFVYVLSAVTLFADEPVAPAAGTTPTAVATPEAAAVTPTYIGASKCKMCHKGEKNGNIYEAWEASAHANSMKILVEKGEDKNPACLACHTTGYGAGGYGAEGMVEAELGSVGCESCHGAGSEYKSMKVMKDKEASLAAGLLIPNEATCTKCHNEKSPTFKGFNYAEYWAKIAHKLPEAAAATPKP